MAAAVAIAAVQVSSLTIISVVDFRWPCLGLHSKLGGPGALLGRALPQQGLLDAQCLRLQGDRRHQALFVILRPALCRHV